MFDTALTIADKSLDVMLRKQEEYTGLYDRVAVAVMTLFGLANFLYPLYSGPAHLAIPHNVFTVITFMIALPFLSIFMFVEAGHWEGIAQLIRIVLGTLFLATFALLIVVIINDVYLATQVAPNPAPFQHPVNLPYTDLA